MSSRTTLYLVPSTLFPTSRFPGPDELPPNLLDGSGSDTTAQLEPVVKGWLLAWSKLEPLLL